MFFIQLVLSYELHFFAEHGGHHGGEHGGENWILFFAFEQRLLMSLFFLFEAHGGGEHGGTWFFLSKSHYWFLMCFLLFLKHTAAVNTEAVNTEVPKLSSL